jgi:hypothetical protein
VLRHPPGAREMGVERLPGAIGFAVRIKMLAADQWPDDVRLSDIEPRFICSACGKRGADVRPDFNWT